MQVFHLRHFEIGLQELYVLIATRRGAGGGLYIPIILAAIAVEVFHVAIVGIFPLEYDHTCTAFALEARICRQVRCDPCRKHVEVTYHCKSARGGLILGCYAEEQILGTN